MTIAWLTLICGCVIGLMGMVLWSRSEDPQDRAWIAAFTTALVLFNFLGADLLLPFLRLVFGGQ